MKPSDPPLRFSAPLPLSRREMLVTMLALGGVLVMSRAWGRATGACLLTPRQTEGPYYPSRTQIEAMLDKDNDLTQIGDKPGRARGQVIYVMGQVRDDQCRPIEEVMVEIWQASENGRYHHPRDEGNPAPLDPHFQYWGKYTTKEDGRYLFKTIKPGAYQAQPGWIRPAHVHFKINHPRAGELTTQMYFAGDSHQDTDYILERVPRAERNRVIVALERPGPDYEAEVRLCRFDLTLRGK